MFSDSKPQVISKGVYCYLVFFILFMVIINKMVIINIKWQTIGGR